MGKIGRKIFSRQHATATFLLIALSLSILTPILIQSSTAADSFATSIPKKVDIFEGSFSPQEVVAAPGETFNVTFSLCPTIDTPNTVINFVLPADLVKLVSGNQVWTGDLKKGESLTLALSLATNGEVDVYVKAEVEASPSDKDYRSSYYLHVATPNAGVDPTEAGPVKSVSLEYVSNASNPESSRALENPQAPQSPGTFEVKGQFWYLNEGGGWSPARYMWVRLRDYDDGSWSVSGWTSGDGHFDFVAANSPGKRSPILDLIAEGEWDWKSLTDGGAQYWWTTGVLAYDVPDGWLYENNGLGAAANSDALQAGDAVYAEAQWIYDRTGWARSQVTIHWPSGTWAHSHGNSIDLPLKTTGAWNHVTVQHEEGHCVMWALYGHWPPGSGPSPHYIWSESSYGFAICEGWAEFMMCAVDNNPNNWVDWYNGHGGNMETNDWYNCQTNGNLDGAIIEGSIASILWDINDPVNIAGDNDHMGWGFDEIFTVMRYDQPDTIYQFWDDWKIRWPTVSTSVGPLCDIYWNYGIDEDYPPWGTPWGSISINAGATYTNSRTVTLTLSADDWGSGVRYMRFSENMGTWGSWYTYATTFTYTLTSAGDGYKTIDVQFADYWSQPSAEWTIWDGITLDTTPPTGSISINAGATYTTSRTVTLTLSATDSLSGVYQMRFAENMGTWGSWYTYATTYSYTLTSAGDGSKMVDVQFKDYAGNISPAWSIWDSIILDTTYPTGSIIINNGNPTYTTTTAVTLYLTYNDATSGVYQVRYGNLGETWGAWEAPAATKAWTLIAGDGTKTVYYQIKDNAGWISQYTDQIVLDTVAPVTTISHSPGSSTVSLSATDATSGVKATYYRIDAGSWITYTVPFTLTGTGSHTIDYYSQDNAGNTEATKQLKVHYLTVNTDPAGITTISGTGWYDQGTTATTGTAPATVTSGGITYTFSTWKKDGAPVGGNPISIFMDNPHTATAVYTTAPTASITIWADKTVYHIGETMNVYIRVKNPGPAPLPVRVVIALKLTDGSYRILLDVAATLPATYDSGDILWNSFVIPNIPLGNYVWTAALLNPSTNAVISLSTWNWQVLAATTTETPVTNVIIRAKLAKLE